MTDDDVRARFEARVRDWPNYTERTLVRDGRCPDYYGNPVVQGAWEGYRASHADLSGEVWELLEDAERALTAWDSTTLPRVNDGMLQERMESLRAALAKFTKEKP